MAAGLKEISTMHPVAGIRLSTVAAGIKKADRPDLVVIECSEGTVAASVFTRNRFCAAPVQLARSHLATTSPRALLINTGYANAGTGDPGINDARTCCRALAAELVCEVEAVVPFSTGVIGERLPTERIVTSLPGCVEKLSDTGWVYAAHGIMTTDTQAKGSSRQIQIGAATVTITGIAKGAGMIRPDMATMLAFIASDAKITKEILQTLLQTAVASTFNRITVDGDTSTNDACVLLATGRADNEMIDDTASNAFRELTTAVTEVCLELAQAIVRDAEGATKFITIKVSGGSSNSDCLEIAYTIAHSPLVKTAFFASDPNWGRILAAIGRAKVSELEVNAIAIFLNDLCVISDGVLADSYTEAEGKKVMAQTDITAHVKLGKGEGKACVWTSDLSQNYVNINAEYRT